MRTPLLRITLVGIAVPLLVTSCTELPNDVGVRPHRFPRARRVIHPPVVAIWNDDPTLKGDPRIEINLTLQQAFFFRGKTLVGQSTISTGRPGYETPPGKYRELIRTGVGVLRVVTGDTKSIFTAAHKIDAKAAIGED